MRIMIIISICVCFVAMLVLTSCGRSPSYRNFMSHDQNYYAQVAKACDELLTKIPNSFTNGQVVSGDDKSLPLVLRQLNATKITIGTNRVWIVISDSRFGFGIVWEPSDYDNAAAPWELTTYAEGMRKVVFSMEKSKGVKPDSFQGGRVTP